MAIFETVCLALILCLFICMIICDIRDRFKIAPRKSWRTMIEDMIKSLDDRLISEGEQRNAQRKGTWERMDLLTERMRNEEKLQLTLAGGGVWQTQSGHTLRIRDMSTNHLQNTLRLFASRSTQEPFISMQRELERRNEDAMWQRLSEKRKETEATQQLILEERKKAIKRCTEDAGEADWQQALQILRNRLEGKKIFNKGVGINTILKMIDEVEDSMRRTS